MINSNIQSSIQISVENKFLLTLKQLYERCLEVLQVNESCIRYFPPIFPPYNEAFQKIISINATQRDKRQQQALQLTSVYFMLNIQEQRKHQNQYFALLGKLRQIPLKIKSILSIHNVYTKIVQSLDFITQFSDIQDQQYSQFAQHILTPTQIINICEINVQIVQQILKQKFQTKITERKYQYQKDKNQLHTDFPLQKNQIKLYLWKYKACVICSLTLLQKCNKKIILPFLKSTQLVLKTEEISSYSIAKIYIFCINNIIKNQTNFDEQNYIYFQLELQKLLNKKKALNFTIQDQIRQTLQRVKQKTQQKIFNNFTQSEKVTIPQHRSTLLKSFLKTQKPIKTDVAQLNRMKCDQTQLKQLSLYNNLRYQNIHSLKKSSKIHTQSKSIHKIKQYQISLGKLSQKKNPTINIISNNESLESNRVSFKFQSTHSVSISLDAEQKSQTMIKLKNTTRYGNHYHNNMKINNKYARNGNNKTTRTNRIYLTIRDKVSKEATITVKQLDNQIYMMPDFTFEKPKVTLAQIMIDLKNMQSRQNDSQSCVINSTVNQALLMRISIQLQFFLFLKETMYTFQITKLIDYSQHFSCIVRYQGLEFKLEPNNAAFFTFKDVKSLVQSTDLFFEVMQSRIKTFKMDPCLALALQIKQLNYLQKQDPSSFQSYANCLNYIIQISNYIHPYLYWYYTKKIKLNGSTFQKRQQLKMSDPLKFSINLQCFKKNNYYQCVQLFHAIRNKKGFRECLIYLWQGREILCKKLIKQNGQFFIQIFIVHSKYLRQFDIDKNKKLIFPIIKLYKKKYLLTQKLKKQLSQSTKNKSFRRRNSSKRNAICITQGSIPKRSEKKPITKEVIEQEQEIQKINMKDIFTNQQCNRILIYNLNQNHIQKRYIERMLQFLTFSQKKQQINQIQKNDQKINFGQLYEKRTKLNFVKIQMNKQSAQFLQISNKSTHCQYLITLDKQRQQIYERNDKPLIIIQNKLFYFTSFLNRVSQIYEQSLNFTILSQKRKKIKIGSKYYQLKIFIFPPNRYLIILRDNVNFKRWLMYVTQKQLRKLYLLTAQYSQRTDKDAQKTVKNSQRTAKYSQRTAKCSQRSPKYSQTNYLLDGLKCLLRPVIKQSITQTYNDANINMRINLLQQKKTQEQKQSPKQLIFSHQEYQANYLYFLPEMLAQKSDYFEFFLLKTPFYNQFAIKTKNTEMFFLNVACQYNKFSIALSYTKVFNKQIIKSQHFHRQRYLYLAVAFDTFFHFWRIDIYDRVNQERYFVFIPNQTIHNFLELSNLLQKRQLKQQESNKISQIWKSIFKKKQYELNFSEFYFSLNDTKYRLFQTFGKITIPPKDYKIKQSYEQYEQSQTKINYLKSSLHGLKEKQNLTQNSGIIQLIKHNQQVRVLVLNYEKKIILCDQIQQNPYHLFGNIFSDYSYKQPKDFMYKNLFKRVYQRFINGGLALDQVHLNKIAIFQI